MDRERALALLEWYRAMGVDETIADLPVNWFAREALPLLPVESGVAAPSPAAASSSRMASPRTAPSAQPPVQLSGEGMEARYLARSTGDIEELRRVLEAFDGCALKKTATNLCLSRGAVNARIMLIGEAPGKEEDAAGLPFVGRAGQLLDRMLASIQLAASDVYITNLVFWRPPGNRAPSPEEAELCQPFVERQIELVKPEILVLLGNAAAKQLTGATDGILKVRGKWMTYSTANTGDTQGHAAKAIATLHPAYLLRNPIAKRLAWRDLLTIREALDGNDANR